MTVQVTTWFHVIARIKALTERGSVPFVPHNMFEKYASAGADLTDHSLPTRRDRLHALMRLKTQRRNLIVGVVALLVIAAALLIFAIRADATPEAVPIGRGVAGVEGAAPADATSDPGLGDPGLGDPGLGDPGMGEQGLGEQDLGEGQASYYGTRFAGKRTASGERFNPADMTAAHRTLPMGSRVRVTNISSGDSVVVRINDRGPFHSRRVIDLSKAAAQRIGLLSHGVGRVRLALLL